MRFFTLTSVTLVFIASCVIASREKMVFNKRMLLGLPPLDKVKLTSLTTSSGQTTDLNAVTSSILPAVGKKKATADTKGAATLKNKRSIVALDKLLADLPLVNLHSKNVQPQGVLSNVNTQQDSSETAATEVDYSEQEDNLLSTTDQHEENVLLPEQALQLQSTTTDKKQVQPQGSSVVGKLVGLGILDGLRTTKEEAQKQTEGSINDSSI